jgi:DNA replication protein DnaC
MLRAARQLARRLRVLSHAALLVVDEIGYLHRYEHASTVLTSNKGFEDWARGDEVMAAALIDRRMPHCHVVNIRGNSYRMREHADLRLALRPSPDLPASEPV